MVVHVLHNPGAGRAARRAVRKMLSHIRADGDRVVDLGAPTSDASSLLLKEAIDRSEVDRLVIAGGDGLIHLAVQHLATTDIPVTIAPVGSGNDFARAISEHCSANGTSGVLADLIRVSSSGEHARWAASVAIAGFPASINARANTMTRSLGSSVYTIAAALELPSFERSTIDVSIDGIPITTDSAMLAIGNTRYFGGGMLPCPDAEPDDGLLHLTSIEGVSRTRLLPHLLGRTGGTADRKEVLRGTGQRIDIDDSGHEFWADGEPLGTSPLSFEVVVGGLRIERVAATG